MLAAAPGFRIVEQVRRIAPFGLGLWDTVTRRLISDGIDVRVFRGSNVRGAPPTPGVASRNGIFVPHDLLGAASFDEALRPVVSPPETLIVEVRDTRDRYTSFLLELALPSAAQLLVPPYAEALEVPFPHEWSPPKATVYLPLFPLPAQPVPAGMAVVRARLVDVNGSPAAFAVLEVRHLGQLLARGIADERGEVAAIFAYPEAAPLPLIGQRWKVQVAVRHRRHLPLVTTDPTRAPLPDLGDVLGQDLAQIEGSPLVSGDLTLIYGREAVAGVDPDAEPGGDRRAELLISPA
jgi:hypothetical protein